LTLFRIERAKPPSLSPPLFSTLATDKPLYRTAVR
jgi:hypothetical protein